MELNFTIYDENYPAKVSFTKHFESDTCLIYKLCVSSNEKFTPELLRLSWRLPMNDTLSVWSPRVGMSRFIAPNWRKTKTASTIASGAPVTTLVNADGTNACTISVSDPKTPVELGVGASEETALMDCYVKFFTSFVAPIDHYEAYVRFDFDRVPFTKVVQKVSKWWENDLGYAHAYVPKSAYMPMNSAWYSFHQALYPEKILEECRLSAPLGLDTIILDDGWQTDDNNRGYRFCGDWEVAAAKIPDMRALVDEIHSIGMKVMLWFSVPFVGVNSKAYERFKNKSLYERDGVLTVDIRYKEVRDYLVGIYKNAVISYGLDGLKLDFIDSFRLAQSSPAFNDQMDIASVEDALDALLKEAKEALIAIDPEILIEFRQSYIGPTILKYGNMIRVGDCPYDSMRNRMGIVDLRLTSGKTAVHSDMIMWNENAPVEAASLQMISTLFGVPQVSVLIKDLPGDHVKALKFWLDFYRENVELLHSDELSVKNPEMAYSQVKTTLNGSLAAVNYANVPFDIDAFENDNCVYNLINSTYEKQIIINAKSDLGRVNIKIFNCMGELVENKTAEIAKGAVLIDVPACSLLKISK